ncbi:hypothetical protein LOTGIDRAFT_175133 [Lottia gigantea]|uniref:C-type lectin domain-containing protein n=1 Tax=Lottia gigantea TaxID=225164 RepID=V4ALF5_LOTGI|nr:hypothetical protein LOTGIDRAFT_175133 [Lottia gigantea]ESO95590.1 hypothetical protein LOTGIDRAFT_175133 [Lottia gigantea]
MEFYNLRGLTSYYEIVFTIKGRREGDNQSVYVGAHRTLDDSRLDWINGGTVDESFWQPGEPNNESGDENCVEVQSTGPFNDKSCFTLSGYICQILTKLPQAQERVIVLA